MIVFFVFDLVVMLDFESARNMDGLGFPWLPGRYDEYAACDSQYRVRDISDKLAFAN